MKKLVLPLILVALTTLSAAAQQCSVLKAEAYRQVRMPGNIPVDEMDQPRKRGGDTLYTIYLESNSNTYDWKWAWVGGRRYRLVALPKDPKGHVIGQNEKTGADVTITQGKGKYSWLYELQAAPKMKAPRTVKSGTLLIQGKCCNKQVLRTIPVITNLISPPSV